VGLPAPATAPGRGEAGDRPCVAMVGREEVGPMEARKLGDLPLAGPGEGVGLGGWREAIWRRTIESVSNKKYDVESVVVG
jgi:hypothetical protein